MEIVARDVTSLNFEYLEDNVWASDWPEFLNRYPTAVRLAVGVAIPDREQERLYRRLVYWPAMPDPDAAAGGGGTGGGGSESNPADAPEGGGS